MESAALLATADLSRQQFKSTWLTGSLEALKKRGYFERYKQHLDPAYHDALFGSVAGAWLPVELAVAHYAACEALQLSPQQKLEMGMDVGAFAHRSFIAYALQVARGAGVGPWAVLDALPRLWSRMWRGGSLEVVRVGPKDARVNIQGWPLARFSYNRIGTRGILLALTSPLAGKVYVRELEGVGDAVAYRVAWA